MNSDDLFILEKINKFADKYIIAIVPNESYFKVYFDTGYERKNPILGEYVEEPISLQKVTYICMKCGIELNETEVYDHILYVHVNRGDINE